MSVHYFSISPSTEREAGLVTDMSSETCLNPVDQEREGGRRGHI